MECGESMNAKTTYKTKQRQELLRYLKDHQGAHITVGDVCDHFKGVGAAIGQTTVYRHLERMVDEGLVYKYVIDPGTPACFEYMAADSHAGQGVCFHCKCEKCGKLIHLSCEEMQHMQAHLSEEHHFNLDPRRTVLYGICEECA